MLQDFSILLLDTGYHICFISLEIYDRPLEGVGTLDVKVNEEEFAEVRKKLSMNETLSLKAPLICVIFFCG